MTVRPEVEGRALIVPCELPMPWTRGRSILVLQQGLEPPVSSQQRRLFCADLPLASSIKHRASDPRYMY